MHDSCIGRDRELAQLDLFLGSGDDGLRLVMLSGPSGQGKTTLSGVTTERAASRGFRVSTVRGRAGSLSVPFQPFLDALPELQVLFEVISAGDGSTDIEHAGIGIVNLIAELVQTSPLMLVFDDAQALDESSIALLPYLAGISENTNLTLLFVEQTDAIGVSSSYRSFIDGLLARRVVSHLRLGPLEDDAIRTIAARVLELEDPADVAPEIVLRAQGNPWFAQELASSARRGMTELPTTIAAAATSRLHTLDESGQDLVLATALCPDGAHVGWLEELSGVKPRAFVKLMEQVMASGLVREDGDIITIAHPLMQQALDDELSAAMRRAIHLELADVTSAAQVSQAIAARSRGYHLAAAGRSQQAVAEYLSAAEAHEVHGQLHEAYADLVHALDAETGMDERIELLRRCAGLAMQVDRDRAEGYWIELGRISAARGDNETYAYSLFQQYWTCNDGSARDRLERAAALGMDEYGWAARAAANIASLDGDFAEAERRDRVALAIAVERGDDMLRTLATHRLGVSLAILGHAESTQVLREAVGLAIQHRLHGWAVFAWGDLTENLSTAVRASDALGEAIALKRYVEDLGLDRMRGITLAWLANAHLRCGDLESAMEASIQAAMNPDLDWYTQASPLIAMLHAEIAIERNDPSARTMVESAEAMSAEVGNDSWADQLSILRLRADARGGSSLAHATSGMPGLLEQIDENQARAEALVWFARAAALQRDDAALACARELRSVLQPDVEYVNVVIAELEALFVAIETGDYAPLELVANRWSAGGRALDNARVSAVVGAIRLHRGDSAGAKDLLHAAKGALNACGASGDADVVASLLRQTGARSRAKSRTTNVGPLTKRELEIARLVASGLKNSEVAASLFLAEKTVAAHLSNIYGKVEVRSRVQLGAWIREHDPEFETALAG